MINKPDTLFLQTPFFAGVATATRHPSPAASARAFEFRILSAGDECSSNEK
jgi:hypothetical protein